MCIYLFFFFKQKTAYEVRISDWSSDVCSSDLNETTTLFQIWIIPRSAGGSPSWGAKPFPKDDRSGKFMVLASGYEADEGALKIGADARVLGATLKAGESLTYDTVQGSHAYLVPATGKIDVNGTTFNARDGAAITGGEPLVITALEDSEVVLVDAE